MKGGGARGKVVKNVIVQYADDTLDFVKQGMLFYVKNDSQKATLYTFGQIAHELIGQYVDELELPAEKAKQVKKKIMQLQVQSALNFTHPTEENDV